MVEIASYGEYTLVGGVIGDEKILEKVLAPAVITEGCVADKAMQLRKMQAFIRRSTATNNNVIILKYGKPVAAAVFDSRQINEIIYSNVLEKFRGSIVPTMLWFYLTCIAFKDEDVYYYSEDDMLKSYGVLVADNRYRVVDRMRVILTKRVEKLYG